MEVPSQGTHASSKSRPPKSMIHRWALFGISLLLTGPVAVSATPPALRELTAVKSWGINRSTSVTRNKPQEKVECSVKPQIDMDILSQSSSPPAHERESPLKIIIMGAPASGKGTQSHIIASKHNLVHLSTGDMLRAAVAQREHHKTVAIAKTYMDAGKLVPDELMIQIVLERIKQRDCQERGWLLDGFPRTQAQAEAMTRLGIAADSFIFLNVPDKTLMERVVGRRTDPVTGKIYQLTLFPPPAEIRQRLVHREDDTLEKMASRLKQFHENVIAVRRYFEDILVEIDGSGTPATVSASIQKAIAATSCRVC